MKLGADPEQLDQLAARFLELASRLDAAVAQLDRMGNGVWWRGPVADDFRSQWRSSGRSQLLRIRSDLADQAGILRRNAAEQRAASEGGGPVGSRSAATAVSTGAVVGGGHSDAASRTWHRALPTERSTGGDTGRRLGLLTEADDTGSSFTGIKWKTGGVDGYQYMAGDDGIALAEGDYGARFGFDEDGEPVAMVGADARIARANLDGVLVGDDRLGLTAGVDAEFLEAEASVGYEDGTAEAKVGVNFASAGIETGANIGGANVSANGEIGLKAELGFRAGIDGFEVKLPLVSFGVGFSKAK